MVHVKMVALYHSRFTLAIKKLYPSLSGRIRFPSSTIENSVTLYCSIAYRYLMISQFTM
jgi:hypothetical protein